MSQENVEVVRRVYEALNRGAKAGGVGSWVEVYDVKAEYEPAEEHGAIRGHEALVKYFRRWLEAWTDITWDIEEIIAADDQVVVAAVIRAKARGSGIAIDQRFFHVFAIYDGKVLHQREYLDRDEALEAVGLRE